MIRTILEKEQAWQEEQARKAIVRRWLNKARISPLPDLAHYEKMRRQFGC